MYSIQCMYAVNQAEIIDLAIVQTKFTPTTPLNTFLVSHFILLLLPLNR